MFLKDLNKLPIFIFMGTGFLASAFFYGHQRYFIALFIIFISLLSSVIFGKKEAYAFRFLYPGIITFLCFMILPIVFTVYIGFTNLSTGHYLSQEEALNAIKQERFIKEGSPIATFELHQHTGDQFDLNILLEGKPLHASFTLDNDDKRILLIPGVKAASGNKLSRGQIYDQRSSFIGLEFITPDDAVLKYFRTNKLANFKSTYRYNESKAEIQKHNGIKYIANNDTGFFEDTKTGDNLLPGFFVFTGFKNFVQLFKDQSIRGPFFDILKWTFTWGFFSVVLTFSAGMFLAIVLNEKQLFGKKIYRTLFVVPYSIPFFISVLIFRGMLNKDFGIINEVLANFGVTQNIPWLETPILAKISCLLVNLWLGFPYMFLVTTGILQSIPSSVYEAATLDGSNTWNTFRKITLPLIMQAIGPILIGSFAFNLNNFIGIYLLTGGGPPVVGSTTPAGSTDILISYTYRLAFEGGQGQNFGLASSISVLIFGAIAIITFVNFRFSGFNKQENN